MRLFFSAGEASGDRYASALLREMKRLGLPEDCIIEGVGGPRLAAEGARLVANSGEWGAIGIAQAFRVGFRVRAGFLKARAELLQGEPGLFIPIDFGFVNIRLCRAAKAAGWKVLYFVPPGSWRKSAQGKDLPGLTDAISTPFSYSASILKGIGANAHWFGHPIKQLISQERPAVQPDRATLAVLPGSRRHEIELNLPVIARALDGFPGEVEFGLAPTLDAEWVRRLWREHSRREDDSFVAGDLYGVLARARAAIVCSGTATLETALMGVPMVVVYQLTALMHFQGFVMGLKRRMISLPNLLLGEWIVPEFKGWRLDASKVRVQIDDLWSGGPSAERQLAAFKRLDEELGADQAISETAKLALDLARAGR